VKLRYDRRATADIGEIHSHIAQHDRLAASRVMARIRVLSEQLTEHPFLGRTTDQPQIRVRSVVRYPYPIFNTLKPDEVVILHFRHAARRQPAPG